MSTAVATATEDSAYTYTFAIDDPDAGDSLTLAASTKPTWLSFNANTGVLSGTPTNNDVGSHNVVLTATDSSGAVTSQSFTITVNNTNDAPTVANAIADQSTAKMRPLVIKCRPTPCRCR